MTEVFLQLFRFFMYALCTFFLLLDPVNAKSDTWFEEYKRYVRKQAQKYNVPGYAFVYYQKGQPPQIVTYGVTHKKGGKVTPQTVFRLASVSKTFTSVMMSKWNVANETSWDTPIGSILTQPEWQQPRFDTLSLGDIVGQSSGFIPNAYDNLIEADYSLQRVLHDLTDLELLCAPGDCYTYQNALFGALTEYFHQRDTSYHRQMQELVFSPLAMDTASVGKAGLMQSESWARPHMAITRSKWRETSVQNNYYRFSPAAGVNASIQDMTRYLQALLGELPQVLPPYLIDEITTPRVKTTRERYRRGWREYLNDAHYGLGWRIYDFDGHTINYHGGWVKGYRADVAFSPETGSGFVMLMNAESNMINSATAEFWARFFENFESVDKQ
ncbi:beta-lactamase family protein [Alteromonas sp. 5E99-2]|uniref:serine hydrolase domain-containing protein n=1 Tax=Alteromonas sp. 5E99-2 TaxID=2817683 RepID=UPI001A9999BF|nr:serine hydrolase domain-containing protein [Alteromonas sp. 5E99-2]MBO1256889.1 beta-lactamase family protein [Alteromonas sp. 5E99-2]